MDDEKRLDRHQHHSNSHHRRAKRPADERVKNNDEYFLKQHNSSYPQQAVFLELPEQSQVGSVLFRKPVITAAAQPTPALTEIAPAGQFMAQAPHSMQNSFRNASAFLSCNRKTLCGQTSTHIPHPVHLSTERFKVSPSRKYILTPLPPLYSG